MVITVLNILLTTTLLVLVALAVVQYCREIDNLDSQNLSCVPYYYDLEDPYNLYNPWFYINIELNKDIEEDKDDSITKRPVLLLL